MKLPKLYKTIGEHRRYNNCRFCFSSNLVPVLDLGNVPLAGGFLKTAKENSQWLSDSIQTQYSAIKK